MNKELRVFVLSAEEANATSYDIENWQEYKQNEDLPQEALDFIKQAEDAGSVYSVVGFMNGFNMQEVSSENDYIFITDKY